MNNVDEVKSLLIRMGLNVYQASVLATLLYIGEAKATTLSKICGVPSARIYDVLNDLVRIGFVRVRPGRPSLYEPISPQDIANSLISWKLEEMRNKIRELENLTNDFVKIASNIYLKGRGGTYRRPLIRVISVGDVSEEETGKLYSEAKKEIMILTQAFEYFPRIVEKLKEAVKKGIKVKILIKDPQKLSESDMTVQRKIMGMVIEELGRGVRIKVVNELPLRGCIIDPDDEGKAIFLVEEKGIPYEFREAAVTSNPGLVKSLSLMFRLLWKVSRDYPYLYED
jgi:sugar-specific transcriptional regulator TrmB